MLIQWRAASPCSVLISSPPRGPRAGPLSSSSPMHLTIRRGPRAYQYVMDRKNAVRDRPDIVAATRGGDDSVGMDGEADPATASLEQALFWRSIYAEILVMEEAVLDRIHQLMAGQSLQARREVELTNVPVVVAQADRFRTRLGFWEACVQAHQ